MQDCTRFQSSDEGPEPQENSQQSDRPSSSPDLEGPGLTPLGRQGRAGASSPAAAYPTAPHLPLPLNLGSSKPLIRALLSPAVIRPLQACGHPGCGRVAGPPGPWWCRSAVHSGSLGSLSSPFSTMGTTGDGVSPGTFLSHLAPCPYAEASWGCSNKFPQTWRPDTTGIYSLTILEAESKIRPGADITVHSPEALGTSEPCVAWPPVAAGIPWLAPHLQISLPLFTSPSPPCGVTSLPLL